MNHIEDIRNYARVNAKSPIEIHDQLVKTFYELYGLIIHIPAMLEDPYFLYTISNYNICPVDGVTNWGNHDTSKPVSYVGWKLNNMRGTIRDINGNIPSRDYISNINKNIIKKFDHTVFNVENMISFIHGVNIDGVSDGYNFKCNLKIFLDDYPHIVNRLDMVYSARSIKTYLGIDDYKAHLRTKKIKMLQEKIKSKTI